MSGFFGGNGGSQSKHAFFGYPRGHPLAMTASFVMVVYAVVRTLGL
jgi:hypothetical protein